MSNELNYSEHLNEMPFNENFTEFGNNSIVYRKIVSPFVRDGFVYLSKERRVLVSSNATPPPSGMFYLCDESGACLHKYIDTSDEGDWGL